VSDSAVVDAELKALGRRHALAERALARLAAVLAALAAEPHPQTKVQDPEEAVTIHVADSLAALELPSVRAAGRIADIGSGAGFPGIPLAVALPKASVDLVEATRRKCVVIERLIAAGAVVNARAIPERAEAWAAGAGREAYNLVTARAVASLAVLVEYAAPLLRGGGTLVAWKGRRDADEERAGAKAAELLGLSPAGVRPVIPFEAARERHLHVFSKRGSTPAGFPRRPGRAAKRPLA
jgi:16S rRNA (guanine527-N7)-methyltransferase